jgi:Flp pilus assembly protein TadG
MRARGHGLGRRGAVAVEFALISVAFLSLLLFVMQLGFRLYAQATLDYATARAARALQVDAAHALSGSAAAFRSGTFCPLLAPLLSCANLAIELRTVAGDYLADLAANPAATSGTIAASGGFDPGQGGSLMLLRVTYLAPRLAVPLFLGPAATLNGVRGAAIVSSVPYANEY